MAKQSPIRPLEGKVSIVGVRPRVSLTERNASVADVSIALTGGSGRTAVPVTFSVGLNVPVSGRARLTDEATGASLPSRPALAARRYSEMFRLFLQGAAPESFGSPTSAPTPPALGEPNAHSDANRGVRVRVRTV